MLARLIAVLSVLLHTVFALALDGEAAPGKPFGVGRITITRGDARGGIDEAALSVRERDGRLHYPSFKYGRFGARIGEALGIGDGTPGNVTILFLFTGNEPLHVT